MSESAPACHLTTPAATPAPAATENKPKPCCVCKPEKETRDECILKYGQDSGKCDSIIGQYKECMKGYGFTI